MEGEDGEDGEDGGGGCDSGSWDGGGRAAAAGEEAIYGGERGGGSPRDRRRTGLYLAVEELDVFKDVAISVTVLHHAPCTASSTSMTSLKEDKPVKA